MRVMPLLCSRRGWPGPNRREGLDVRRSEGAGMGVDPDASGAPG